jgi:hypothetical protein
MRIHTLLCNVSAWVRTFSTNNAYHWVEILKLYDEQCDECLQDRVFVLLPRQYLLHCYYKFTGLPLFDYAFWYPHIFFTGEVHSIQHYGIKFANDLRLFCGFLQALWFPPPIKLTPRFSWNIVESGAKHHNPCFRN